MLRIAIIQFPGSNCERETALAVKRAGMQPIDFLWNEPREQLANMDGYIIVGGFSYEDRSYAGIIAALDPIMSEIKVQSEKGKPVLGICNGAQILVATGLVPGLENNKIGLSLTENKRFCEGKLLGTGYYNAWVYLRLSHHYQRNVFTRYLTQDSLLHVPIAHAEGRFVMSPALWQEIDAQGLAIFQYCDASGHVVPHFPVNPNGSLHNIAAIANKQGNVMAMMPHPERTAVGDVIFKSMRDSILDQRQMTPTVPLYYYPRQFAMPVYQCDKEAYEYVVELLITDNQALTVQNTLQKLGFRVTIKRFVHWEIHADDIELIKKTGVLYNSRKEILHHGLIEPPHKRRFLVREKENIKGQQVLQTLQRHFSIDNIKTIYQGVLWEINNLDDQGKENQEEMIHSILQTHIIANPYAHDCYQYQYN